MMPTRLIAKDRPHHLHPSQATARIAFVTRNYGEEAGLSNIGLGVTNNSMAKVLRRAGYNAESWATQNAHNLRQRISSAQEAAQRDGTMPLSHVVIASPSWISIREIGDLCWKFQEIDFTLINHTGTAYLQIDGNEEESGILANKRAAQLALERHNFKLAANNVRFVAMIEQMLKAPCQYLPNLYDSETYVQRVHQKRIEGTIRIGGFGAPRPWKNQLTAAEAAVMLARELGVNLKFYFNQGSERDDRLSRSRAELFAGERDLELVEIPWEPWPAFRRTIQHMHLMVQPSFDETFNVVTADGIASGTASVVTNAIEWVPERWKAVGCDPGDLVRVGLGLLHDPHTIADGRARLTSYVAASLEIWKSFLGR